MNRKGLTFGPIVKMVLGLFILVFLIVIFRDVSQHAYDSVSNCAKKSGMCQMTCDSDRGEKSILEGKCSEGEICCTSPEIKEMIRDRHLPYRSRRITLEIPEIHGEIGSGETTVLYAGSSYDMEIFVHETSWHSNSCLIEIFERSGGTSRPIISEEKTTCNPSRGNMVHRFEETSFKMGDVGSKYVVQVTIYPEGGEMTEENKLTRATFPLEIKNPVSISGIDDKWSRQKEITLHCLVSGCVEASIGLSDTAGESCGELDSADSAEFREKKAVFDIRYGENSNIEIQEPVCFSVKFRSGETIELHPEGEIKIDTKPPVITGIEETEIQCQDGGSGCEEYYFHIINGVSVQEFIESQESSIWDLGTEVIKHEGIKLIRGAFPATLSTTCPRAGHDFYRGVRPREGYSAFVDVEGDAVSTVCAYAVDKVGNIGHPLPFEVVNTEAVKQAAADKVNQKLDETIGITTE